jgi:predicted Rossmann fold flavoprotein
LNVVVVGGGASGLVAAITARRLGADVTIVEKNPRLGKKILVTGNGRCNLTNINTSSACYHGDPELAAGILSQYDVKETIRFFEKLGISHKVEEAGKVFPMSDQASSVLDVLRYEVEQTGIKVLYEARVLRRNSCFIALDSGRGRYAFILY